MAIQDNFWTIGNEAVAYGTRAATLTRGIENQTDDVTPNVEHRVSQGMRPGTVATPVGRSVAHQYGGSVYDSESSTKIASSYAFAAASRLPCASARRPCATSFAVCTISFAGTFHSANGL